MEVKKMVEKLNDIEMSKEMQERIVRNCYIKMEEEIMNKNTEKRFFRRPLVIAASLALCLCVIGTTTLAATGKLGGFFKDITRWDGAVIGSVYEQATNEVELNVIDASDGLMVEVTMLKPDTVPYSVFEEFGIESYEIVDVNGNVVVNGKADKLAQIADGKVTVRISLNDISDGEYKLVVRELVGSSKADQPLVLKGWWECDFSK